MRKPSSFKLNPHLKREILFGSSSGSGVSKISSSATGNLLMEIAGQSNPAGSSFNEVDAGFTEDTVSTDIKYIKGGQPPETSLNEPNGYGVCLGGNLLGDGSPITLDSTNITWTQANDYSIASRLAANARRDIPGLGTLYVHTGSKGGTSAGDWTGEAIHGGSTANVNNGGLLRAKYREWVYHYENHETGGVEPDFDLKVHVYWQGENSHISMSQGSITLAQAEARREALHAKMDSLNMQDKFDLFIEVQPVYWGTYWVGSEATWVDAYADVVASFKAKAEARPNTIWVPITSVLADSASYQLTTAGAFNNGFHLNPSGYYAVADLIWAEIFSS